MEVEMDEKVENSKNMEVEVEVKVEIGVEV